ncbi:MAG: 3',5'-cyclic-nucleotide phosphodiesterase [Deltaproteobacteria bacterium]|nr:3',5'-cyclic-nucleotide phosphodiesterase [Deltaproteobacteria bacterium]
MRVRVLGCHGGESPQHLPTSFLVDGVFAIDAGSICRSLEVEAQARIDDILISHCHLDHVKDLALLADQVFSLRSAPVNVHCGPETARALKRHLFNDVLWPDFTRLPSKSRPALRLRPHPANRTFGIGNRYRISLVPVSHPVESMGIIVRDKRSSFFFSSDTGPTDKLWRAVRRIPNLRAAFVELSFPNNLQQLADTAGHLTPYSLSRELGKLSADGLDVFVYHMKPAHAAETKRELRALRSDRIHALTVGDVIDV